MSGFVPDSTFDFIESDSREALAHRLARRVASALRDGIGERGGASLVVPGGSTPVHLFEALRLEELDWPRVSVTLSDERWVANFDPASNEALVRNQLLRDRAATARFVPLRTDASTAKLGIDEIEARISTIERPFDCVVLGMGTDAHTASLFPGMPRLSEALDLESASSIVAARAPSEPRERVSLTLTALARCRRLVLLIHGEEKRRVLQHALELSDQDAPIAAILRAVGPRAEIFWAP